MVMMAEAVPKADGKAFLTEAVRLHSQAIYNLALRIARNPQDAEDIVQETFAALVREERKIREPGALKTWLLRTAIRIAWKESSRVRRRRLAEREAATREEGIGMEARSDLSEWISRALDRLPESLRLPLVLHYLQGLAHAEVAAVLGCPLGSVSTRMRDGLERLRKAAPAVLGVLALAELEEALEALAPEPLPPSLAFSRRVMGNGAVPGSLVGIGGMLMTTKTKLMLLLALLLAGLGGWAVSRERGTRAGPPPVMSAGRSQGPVVTEQVSEGVLEPAGPGSGRVAGRVPAPGAVGGLLQEALHLLLAEKLKELGALSASEPWAFDAIAALLEGDDWLADYGTTDEQWVLQSTLASGLAYGPPEKCRALGLSLIRDGREGRLSWGLTLLDRWKGWKGRDPIPDGEDPELKAELLKARRDLESRGALYRASDWMLSTVLWALGDEETPKRLMAVYEDPRNTAEERARAEGIVLSRLRDGRAIPSSWLACLEGKFKDLAGIVPNDVEPGAVMEDELGREFTSGSGPMPDPRKSWLALAMIGVSPAARDFICEDLRQSGVGSGCVGNLCVCPWQQYPELVQAVDGLTRSVLDSRDLRKLSILTRAMGEVPGDPKDVAAWYASLTRADSPAPGVDPRDAMLAVLFDGVHYRGGEAGPASVAAFQVLRGIETDPDRLLKLDYILAGSGDDQASARVAKAVEAPGLPTRLRMQGVTLLLKEGRTVEQLSGAVKQAAEGLSSGETDVSFELSQWVKEVPPGPARNELACRLWVMQEDPRVRLRMVEGVTVRENPWLRDALKGMLKEEGAPWSKVSAASRLVRGGEMEAGLPALLEYARPSAQAPKLFLKPIYDDLGWLASRGNPKALEGLHRLLAELGPPRYWAAVALGKLGDKRAIPALREILDTPAGPVGRENGYDSCIDIPKALAALGDEDLKRRYAASGRSQ
jgi:RNA polymerase sigma-70 factor (ECF subfamily)